MLICRNITVGGHRTSIRLEPEFWGALAAIALREGQTIDQVCTEVDHGAGKLSRTAAIRVFITSYMVRLSELEPAQHAINSIISMIDRDQNQMMLNRLPPPDAKHWAARDKAAVVAAVKHGAITLDEVCRRYSLSVEEYLTWGESAGGGNDFTAAIDPSGCSGGRSIA